MAKSKARQLPEEKELLDKCDGLAAAAGTTWATNYLRPSGVVRLVGACQAGELAVRTAKFTGARTRLCRRKLAQEIHGAGGRTPTFRVSGQEKGTPKTRYRAT